MNTRYICGLLFVLIFAVPAYYLGQSYPIIGGPVFAILLGIMVAKIGRPASFEVGIRFASKNILQYSIILLGFEMNLIHIVEIGMSSLSIMIFTLLTAFLAAYFAGKVLKLDFKTTTLIGVGTAICGGSAIAAVAPVIGAKDKDIASSISTIFLFNIMAVFIFPFLGHIWGLSNTGFGMWAGTAINDTSSVVAAGYSYSKEAGDYATIVKLTRALMIVPVCLVLAFIMAHRKESNSALEITRIIPWFIIWFIVAAIINTTGILPATVSHAFGTAGKFLIILAMCAIGLSTDINALINNGLRSIVLGLVCWIAVSSISLIVQHLIGLI